MPDTYTPASVTEAAQIDAQNAKAKLDAMKQRMQPPRPGDPIATTDLEKVLTAPVRIDLPFGDPIATRELLFVLAGACSDAIAISQDQNRGALRAVKDMRRRMREAAIEIAHRKGMTPRSE